MRVEMISLKTPNGPTTVHAALQVGGSGGRVDGQEAPSQTACSTAWIPSSTVRSPRMP